MQNIAILGSTGSIGISTLDVVRQFPKDFKVIALTTNSNVKTLYKQIKEFHPELVCVVDPLAGLKLKDMLGAFPVKVLKGIDSLSEVARLKEVEKIVLAVSGAAALSPLLAGLGAGKEIALANKEALVMAGPMLMQLAREKKAKIIPIDSEQSAIWQCLSGIEQAKIKTIYLTASGGPLYNKGQASLKNISLKTVLNHPRWSMGKKISVDSATLMNKGLEFMEAMFLFDMPYEKIKILIHPQALIHSMVEFVDGVVLAQLSATDMRIPIQYALFYPQRRPNTLPRIDFYRLKELNFAEPDFKKFPCLGLACKAAIELGTLPAVLNAANEISVDAFLNGKLKFSEIAKAIETVMGRHHNKKNTDLDGVLAADSWARKEALEVIQYRRMI